MIMYSTPSIKKRHSIFKEVFHYEAALAHSEAQEFFKNIYAFYT